MGFDNLVAGTGATAIGSGNKVYDEYAFAIGYGNKAEEACQARGWENEALGFAAVAEGYRNLAGNSLGGVGAHAEGRNTKAINLCSHSEGERTTAAAHAAHAEGYSSNVYDKDIESLCTLASGIGSHAEGIDTHAHGSASHAEGLCTKAINSGEHACGKYNVSNNDTQFSIGIGTSNTDRKNAIEVTEDGSTYIHGIGGYDGTNANAAKSVQEVIAELQEIVSQITLKVEE